MGLLRRRPHGHVNGADGVESFTDSFTSTPAETTSRSSTRTSTTTRDPDTPSSTSNDPGPTSTPQDPQPSSPPPSSSSTGNNNPPPSSSSQPDDQPPPSSTGNSQQPPSTPSDSPPQSSGSSESDYPPPSSTGNSQQPTSTPPGRADPDTSFSTDDASPTDGGSIPSTSDGAIATQTTSPVPNGGASEASSDSLSTIPPSSLYSDSSSWISDSLTETTSASLGSLTNIPPIFSGTDSSITGTDSLTSGSSSSTESLSDTITSAPASVSSYLTTVDGTVSTIMVTKYITTVNGEVITITETIAVGVHTTPSNTSIDGAAIIGGAVGGAAALLLIALAAFLVWRRSKHRMENAHRRVAGVPATMSQRPRNFDLAGGTRGVGFTSVGPHDPEDPFAHADDDDDLLFPHAGSPTSLVMGGAAAGPLLRPRGSQTGSIFHETGIWPPPGAASAMRDPLHSTSEVDFGTIVEDVMGVGSTTDGPGPSRLRGGAPSSADPFADYASPIAGTPVAATFTRGDLRDSSSSSSAGVMIPLLGDRSAPHPADPPHRAGTPFSGSASAPRSRLTLVTPETAGPSANPFSDAKAAQATSRFRSSLAISSGPPSADGHATTSEGHGGTDLTLNTFPAPQSPEENLIDLTPGQEAELTMPSELPPQYHTIRRQSGEKR